MLKLCSAAPFENLRNPHRDTGSCKFTTCREASRKPNRAGIQRPFEYSLLPLGLCTHRRRQDVPFCQSSTKNHPYHSGNLQERKHRSELKFERLVKYARDDGEAH